MTFSESNTRRKLLYRVILFFTIIFRLLVIGFFGFWCLLVICASFDRTATGIGSIMGMIIAHCMMFVIYRMVRFLIYADNEDGLLASFLAWVMHIFLSIVILAISGQTVSFLVGIFLFHEVEYRSLNLDGCWIFISSVVLVAPWSFVFLFVIGLFCMMPKILTITDALSDEQSWQRLSIRKNILSIHQQDWKKDLAVIALLYAILSALAFSMLVANLPPPISGSHMTYDAFHYRDMFPAEGSDFSYQRGSEFFLCEFTCSEEDFQHWIKIKADLGWKIDKILPNEPHRLDPYDQEEEITITDGLIAIRKMPDDDDSEFAVFDRGTHRVHYRRYR